MRKQRSRKNAAKKLLSSDSPAYKSKCSLGKAVKKAQAALLNSPRKRPVVLKKLSLQFSTDSVDSKPKVGPTELPKDGTKTLTSTEFSVLVLITFLLNTDILGLSMLI